VGSVAVMVGGRGERRADIYDPRTNLWKAGAYPPNNIKLHHHQCAVLDNKLWLVASWTNGYPMETNAEFIYIYDPFANIWTTRPPMPLNRRRGSTAVIPIEPDLLFVSHGSIGGHETANHSTSYAWLDVYNITSQTWEALPDGIYPRDHTGGALMADGRICISGGRDGGTINWPVVLPTECYNPKTKVWTVESDIPFGRAGANYGTSCDGRLIIAGGEQWTPSPGALKRVDVFDGKNWIRMADMKQTRHGSGLAVDCECQAIYVASGNLFAGGGRELPTMETFHSNGVKSHCFSNPIR
jgi:large repetitive protein